MSMKVKKRIAFGYRHVLPGVRSHLNHASAFCSWLLYSSQKTHPKNSSSLQSPNWEEIKIQNTKVLYGKRNEEEEDRVGTCQGKAINSTKWYVSPKVWHIRNGTTQPLRQSNKRTQRLQWVEMERSKVNSKAPPIIHRFQWWKMDSFNLPKNRKIESWAVNRPAMKMLKIEAWG